MRKWGAVLRVRSEWNTLDHNWQRCVPSADPEPWPRPHGNFSVTSPQCLFQCVQFDHFNFKVLRRGKKTKNMCNSDDLLLLFDMWNLTSACDLRASFVRLQRKSAVLSLFSPFFGAFFSFSFLNNFYCFYAMKSLTDIFRLFRMSGTLFD